MINEVEILVLPHNLRIASERAAAFLRSFDFDVLYLNIPRELGILIEDLALGAPYEEFINRVSESGILRELLVSWEYRIKPILLAVRGLKIRKPHLEIICYRNRKLESLSVEKSEEIAALTLRVSITGRIDVEEWKSVVYRMLCETAMLTNEEDSYIYENWIRHSGKRAILLMDYLPKRLLNEFKKNGVKTILRYAFTPYYFTPLEVLIRETAMALEEKGKSSIDNERIEVLVRMHVEFIRDYILVSENYDEAYFKWLRDKLPSGIASSFHTSLSGPRLDSRP
mgnify:CR=1 FL=1